MWHGSAMLCYTKDIMARVETATMKTPLYDAHVRLGGRMVEFAGTMLPVQYKGVIAESKAVRERAGMFDVSHMARLRMTGERVLEYLEWVTANDVSALGDLQGQYSMLPNEKGGLVDDIIVYRMSPTDFRMVVNAANHAKDVAHLNSQNNFGVKIEDLTERTAMIAVQGPMAEEIVSGLSDNAAALRGKPFFTVVECNIAGVPCFAPRSGYTGEDGFELICSGEDAEKLWEALFAAGVEPCGLGSRDVLRLEAGLPLYGHELGDDLNPIAAQLGWAIGKEKKFIGSEIINDARNNGTATKLRGIVLEGKRLPMSGMKILVAGREVGSVCSGVFSPTLDRGIAFAYIESNIKPETPCQIDMRGKLEPATVVGKRFLKRN